MRIEQRFNGLGWLGIAFLFADPLTFRIRLQGCARDGHEKRAIRRLLQSKYADAVCSVDR